MIFFRSHSFDLDKSTEVKPFYYFLYREEEDGKTLLLCDNNIAKQFKDCNDNIYFNVGETFET